MALGASTKQHLTGSVILANGTTPARTAVHHLGHNGLYGHVWHATIRSASLWFGRLLVRVCSSADWRHTAASSHASRATVLAINNAWPRIKQSRPRAESSNKRNSDATVSRTNPDALLSGQVASAHTLPAHNTCRPVDSLRSIKRAGVCSRHRR